MDFLLLSLKLFFWWLIKKNPLSTSLSSNALCLTVFLLQFQIRIITQHYFCQPRVASIQNSFTHIFLPPLNTIILCFKNFKAYSVAQHHIIKFMETLKTSLKHKKYFKSKNRQSNQMRLAGICSYNAVSQMQT